MDRDARALAGGVEAGQLGRGVVVGRDAAHVVVGAGPDGDGVVDRVDAGVDHRELARARQAVEDLLRAEMPHVEHDAAVDAAALVDLRLLGAGDDVARGELERVRRVALHEALAVGVDEVRALAAAALGEEDPGRVERRRVELHELHVLERQAEVQRHRHPVAGAGVRVRRDAVLPAGAARREDDRLPADRLQAAVHEVPADDALAAAVVLDELPREELLVHRDVALADLLPQHLDEDVAGDVGREDRARRAGGAERALRELAVVAAGEDRAPVLELDDVAGRFLREELDRVLVADVVGALDRVVRVGLGAVLGGVAERRVDAALGRSRVGTRRVDLRDHRDVGAGVECLDRGAHPCATGPDDEHVVLRDHVE